jgi:UDP-N-acetylmuramoyl-tripeptide--D-alanyl-D-alanine ligase
MVALEAYALRLSTWRTASGSRQNLIMGLAAGRAGQWIRQVAWAHIFQATEPLLFTLAALWRRLLFRTTFIAITGSVGKTTTKELLADILAARARTYRTLGNQNSCFVLALNILRVRPWHRFAVLEVGIGNPGEMRRLARTIGPDVAVILAVARTHTTGFGDLEQCAAEKALLLESLRTGGLAVLNGDDPRVAAMAGSARFRTCLAGTSPAFDLWADQASSRWPDRLSFLAHCGGETCRIQTQQLGCHWVPALTAALAVAKHVGIPLEESASELRSSAPYTGRLEPVQLPCGAIMVRDDYSASIDTFEASLKFLREARAQRRILVFTDFSDSGANRHRRLRSLANAVSGWLDVLILCGDENVYGRRKAIEAGMAPASAHGFPTLSEAAQFLRTELRSGDLVLLKGRSTDHATRVFFALLGTVACWRPYCPKTVLCDACWELGFVSETGYRPPSTGLRV